MESRTRTPPTPDAADRAQPRFVTVRQLGTGGSGRVRLVRDQGRGGVLRALKTAVFDFDAGASASDLEEATAKLLHEARVLSSLVHRGVPRLFEVGRADEDGVWLLMEYVEAAHSMDEGDPAHVAFGLLDTLAHLHRHGWVHTDVKPDNVVAAGGARVVLLDYGLAVRADEQVPPRGTLPFVAPEVLAGGAPDARSDLWSAGAVLLQLVLGRQLPPAATLGPDDVPDDAKSDVPLPAEWLRRLLDADPERRPVSAEAALAELVARLAPEDWKPAPRPLPHAPEPAGREIELGDLSRRMREALIPPTRADEAGIAQPTLVLLRGESGVGKSSVMFEMRLRALSKGWSAFAGSCSEERDAALPALGNILRAALRDAPAESAAVRRRGALVANLLTARGDSSGSETAARFLVERAGETHGLLVVVEDLQNATAMTLRVLGAIARAAATTRQEGRASRLLILASLTDGVPVTEEIDEAVDVLEAEGVLHELPLRPLSLPGVGDLASGVLGPNAPGERVGEILHAHGGASPLFAEQLLERLVASRALRHDGMRWTLDTRVAPRLPESLSGAVAGRLEALPSRELIALQLLSTHELPMSRTHAARYLGADARTILSELESRGLIGPAGDGRSVAVVHQVIGQTALAMLAPERQAKLHDALARAISGHDPASRVRRAFHVARGADKDRGFEAATSIALSLRANAEPGRAAGFVRQALRLLDEDDPRVPTVRRSLAELLVQSGRPTAAANVYRDLLEIETDRASRARLLLGLAEAQDTAGESSEVVATCRLALDLLGDVDVRLDETERADLRLSLLARLAGAQRAIGDLEGAIQTVRGALPLAVEGRGAERAALLTLLGNVYVQLGEFDRARQFHERCAVACRSLGRRRGMATALHNLGVVHARLGERDEARETYMQSLRLSRRARDLGGVAMTLGNLANLQAESGDFAEAEKLQRRSMALYRRMGDLSGVAVTMGNLAGLYRARGRLGTALSLLRTAARRLRALGDVQGEVQFLLQAASIHLLAGDWLGARPLLMRALTRAQAASLRSLEATAETLLGRLERRGDPDGDQWQLHLGRARDLFQATGDRPGLVEAWLETALGERGRGRRDAALTALRTAEELLTDVRNGDLAARTDLVRGRVKSDRGSSTEALASLTRFHEHVNRAGRRDYRVAAAYALSRACLAAGEPARAEALAVEALRADEDLAASLPPALRREREGGIARRDLLELVKSAAAAVPPDVDEADTEVANEDDMDQDRLIKLLEINKQLALAKDVRALLDTIMDVATEATGAERGFLIIVDDGKISFQTARNFKREEVPKPELKVSRTLVTRVMKSGQAVLTDNATEDQRFAEFESVERLELKSIVSVPFRLGDVVMGALYLDNPARKGQFGPGDLQFLTALGDQAALAIRNLRHAEAMQQLNRQLEHNLERKSAQLEQAERALADRATKYPYDDIVGASPQIREVLLLVDKVVETEVPVLIQGESGTGKELIAQAIHGYGRRKDGPFVTVNCGAITESLMESELFGHVKGSFTGAISDKPGLFKAAHGGTIFLDEIGEMSVDMQKKLLRVLQEREVRPVGGKDVTKVDARVIAATNRNLREMMQRGEFREDLYYRIAVINIDMPPLRERKGDVQELVQHFVARAEKDLGLSPKPIDDEAMAALAAYAWPGNVRELDNEVKKALTLSDEGVGVEDLSIAIQGDRAGPEPELVPSEGGVTLKQSLEKTERAIIVKALEKNSGNQTRTAKDLGISRVWLRKKMEKYGLFESKA